MVGILSLFFSLRPRRVRHDSKKGAQGAKRARVRAKLARICAKCVPVRFGHVYVRRTCFVHQVRFGRS